MKIDFCSDLHANHYRGTHTAGIASVHWPTLHNPGSRLLVIAGDTHDHYRKTFIVADRAAEVYDHVLVLDGNHEHYDTKRFVGMNYRRMREKAERRPKVTFLDGTDSYHHDGIVFIGANGWYDWTMMEPEIPQRHQYLAWRGEQIDQPVKRLSNDFRYIRFNKHNDLNYDLSYDLMSDAYHVTSPADWARVQANALRSQIVRYNQDPAVRAIVVVTHTCPLRALVNTRGMSLEDRRLAGVEGNPMMGDLLEIPNHKIVLWIYGHTHDPMDRVIDGVRFVNHSRGYPSEQVPGQPWRPRQLDLAAL